jgi:hypothetical protein
LNSWVGLVENDFQRTRRALAMQITYDGQTAPENFTRNNAMNVRALHARAPAPSFKKSQNTQHNNTKHSSFDLIIIVCLF